MDGAGGMVRDGIYGFFTRPKRANIIGMRRAASAKRKKCNLILYSIYDRDAYLLSRRDSREIWIMMASIQGSKENERRGVVFFANLDLSMQIKCQALT
jgi:hypothetical protein